MLEHTLFIFIFCLILVFLEVQIEGGEGRAKNLPTWRSLDGKWYSKIFKKIIGEKDFTGYHFGMFCLVLFVFHGFYFWFGDWSFRLELRVLSYFFLTAVFWDFLWFIVNPHFGWQKFKPALITWHKSWLGPWPLDYYYGIGISLVLYTFSYCHLVIGLKNWFYIFTLLLILTLFTMAIRVIIDKNK